MQISDEHPLLFAILCMPFLMGAFLIALALLIHIVNWLCKTIANLIWANGVFINTHRQRMTKTTIYSPNDTPRQHESVFLPGAFKIIIKITIFYLLGWGIHTALLKLLS